MKVLLLGGGGQVARAVAAAAPVSTQLIVRTRSELDICDEKALMRTFAETDAQWVVNAAAYTAVDLAEDQPALANAVNDTAVGAMAAAALTTGRRLLHLSTDFVFDGESSRAYRPDDRTNPLNVYGSSKLAGERHVLNADASGIVLRTAWVYAAAGRNFVLTMLRLMREKERLNVVCDQIGTPTWADGIATAIWSLIAAGVPGGVYHWTDLGVATWYDFAVAIQEEALGLGLLSRTVPIMPISSGDYPTRARRPAFSVLDSSATRALVSAPARHWRHSLRSMLRELRAP